MASNNIEFTDTISLDMSTVVPTISGPKRPQDKVLLNEASSGFKKTFENITGRKEKKISNVNGADFKIKDGSECWNLQTEDSFTISNIKYSLIILNDNVIFNNSIGDITAVDIETGLITWQLPTQSSSIINETYNFKTSKLVSDGNSVFFSNNKNQFYSIDLKTGTTNWINEVNSNVKPILVGNLIFTISNEGYLYLIDKNKGNIVRITDLFMNYKDKKRKNIYPIGFVIGDKNVFLTNSDGKMIIAGIEDGKIIKIEKVSGGLVSEPFIFNNNLYVVRNGSIVQYN